MDRDDMEPGNGCTTVTWAGSHDEYELTFKNNKNTIEKWLRRNGYIAFALTVSIISFSSALEKFNR
jgi:hypothetical protein